MPNSLVAVTVAEEDNILGTKAQSVGLSPPPAPPQELYLVIHFPCCYVSPMCSGLSPAQKVLIHSTIYPLPNIEHSLCEKYCLGCWAVPSSGFLPLFISAMRVIKYLLSICSGSGPQLPAHQMFLAKHTCQLFTASPMSVVMHTLGSNVSSFLTQLAPFWLSEGIFQFMFPIGCSSQILDDFRSGFCGNRGRMFLSFNRNFFPMAQYPELLFSPLVSVHFCIALIPMKEKSRILCNFHLL